MTSPSTNGELKYEVTALDKRLVATWFANQSVLWEYNNFLSQELFTYDKKVLKASFDNKGNFVGYKMSKEIAVYNIIKALLFKGYVLQHQASMIEREFRTE